MICNRINTLLFFIFTLILNSNIYGGDGKWKEAQLDNGKISVKYLITDRVDKEGNKVSLIEFYVTTIEQLNIDNCISLMKDISQHRDIKDIESSTLIRTISDNESIVYYLYPSAGPISGFDNVVRFKYNNNQDKKLASFTTVSEPLEYMDKGLKRINYNYETYDFRDLGNGDVELKIHIIMTPVVNAPKWMINLAFPGSAGTVIKNIIKLSKK